MAENIVQGLFGLTPFQVEQQQRAASNAQAAAMAKMDGFELAGYLGGQAGAGIGNVAAGMMGMVNPQVEEARKQEQLMQGADTSTPEGLMAIAKRFNDANMPQQALLAAKAAHELSLKSAQEKYYGNKSSTSNVNSQLAAKQTIARNDALKLGFNGGLRGQDLIDFAENQVQAITSQWEATMGMAATTMSGTPSGETANRIVQLTPDIQIQLPISEKDKSLILNDPSIANNPELVAKVQSLPSTPLLQSKAEVAGSIAKEKEGQKIVETTDANSTPRFSAAGDAIGQIPAQYSPGSKAAIEKASATGKGAGEDDLKQYETVISAEQNLAKIDGLINHLKTSDAITGMGADVFKGINRAVALLGGKEAAKKATDTEILNVMTGSEVFPLIQSLGIGAKGMDTPAEREFMRSVLTGSISLNKATLLRMAQMRKDAAENTISKWNTRIKDGELDNFYQQTGRTKKLIGASSSRVSVRSENEAKSLPIGSKFILPDGRTGTVRK